MGLFDRFRTPKWKHEDWEIRLKAVKELDDKDILVEIAKTDSNCFVRRVAVERIDDESALVDIAKTDSDMVVRNGAVERITDETFLKRVAVRDVSWIVRRDALENINDEEFLKSKAKYDLHDGVCEYAVGKITDEEFLKEIVMSHTSYDVRRKAICNVNLKDEEFLKRKAKQGNHDAILNPNLKDPDFLIECYHEIFYALPGTQSDIKMKLEKIDPNIDVENYKGKDKVKKSKNNNQEEYNQFNHAYEVQQAFHRGNIRHADNLIDMWGRQFPEDANYYYAKIILELHYLNNPNNESSDYFFDLSQKAEKLEPYDYDLHDPLRMDVAGLLLRFEENIFR